MSYITNRRAITFAERNVGKTKMNVVMMVCKEWKLDPVKDRRTVTNILINSCKNN